MFDHFWGLTLKGISFSIKQDDRFALMDFKKIIFFLICSAELIKSELSVWIFLSAYDFENCSLIKNKNNIKRSNTRKTNANPFNRVHVFIEESSELAV